MNPYREPQKPTNSRLKEFFVNRVTRPSVVLAAILIAGIAIAAATPSLRLNGVRFPDGTGVPSGFFNVKAPEWGAVGDGVTDDTAAIQAAVTAAEVKGGTVYFPASNGERYTLTSTITISSLYPVNLVSDMHGYADNVTTGAFIRPGANFGSTCMIEYVAPGGSHGAHGGGLVRGISVYDNTNTTHVPNYTMKAALCLTDFNLGHVENSMFQVLNGGAIKSVFWVMGGMSNVTVRYAGTVSQPAVSLEGSSSSITAQSTSITDSKIEANYGTYLNLNSFSKEVKLDNLGFEADTATASTCNTFLDNSGQQTFMSNIHMNRNTATQWINESASNFTVADNVIVIGNSSQTSNPAVIINGANHQIGKLSITGLTAATTASLSITGAFSTLTDVNIINSGGIALTGNAYNDLNSVYLASMVSGSGSYAIDISGSENHTMVSNAIIKSLPNNTGGIRVTGSAGPTSIVNCEVRDAAGTGIGFRDENSDNTTTWIGNRSFNNATAFSASATAYVARGNSWGGVETETVAGPLTATGLITASNGITLASGKVVDSANTLNLGVTSSTATSISKTGTTMTVNGSLKAAQGFAPAYRSAASTVTVAVTDYFIGVSGTGARTVNLPAASTCKAAGQVFVIQEAGNDAGTITINRAGSDTINGATTTTISAAYGSKTLTCDGTSAWLAR